MEISTFSFSSLATGLSGVEQREGGWEESGEWVGLEGKREGLSRISREEGRVELRDLSEEGSPEAEESVSSVLRGTYRDHVR